MDESSPVQNRRQRRSNFFLTAVVEISGRALDVKLRNLSASGALIEGEGLPAENTQITFRKGDLTVSGSIVWVSDRKAGVHFHAPLTPEALLRHVPTPRPRVLPSFRRPGLASQPMTRGERSLEKIWQVTVAPEPLGD